MSKSRSAARLAAVQAIYQQEMEGTALARLLHEFHQHRLGATIGDIVYAEAEVDFFNDVVMGADARREEIDALITARLQPGWTTARLDKTLAAILRAATYELVARRDIPVGSVIGEYLDVTEAFFDLKEKRFINGILDAIAKTARV